MGKICIPLNTPSGEFTGWAIRCPGCGFSHVLDKRWTFNGNVEAPTFRPSLSVKYGWDKDGKTQKHCHSFITDGKIKFLGDCTHKLKGQTVPLQPWEDEGESDECESD